MILPVDDQYRIAADRYAWALQERKGSRKGAARWESFAWHVSLEQAVNSLAELMVRTSEAQTLADALAEIDRVIAKITHAFSTLFEVRMRGRPLPGKIKARPGSRARRKTKGHNKGWRHDATNRSN